MVTAFFYSIKVLVRDKNVLIWSVAFPLVISSLFYVMFSNLDEAYSTGPLRILVVENTDYRDAPEFSTLLDELSQTGGVDEQGLLDPTFVSSEAEARETMEGSEYLGYILMDSDARPSYFLNPRYASSLDMLVEIRQGIVLSVLDRYTQDAALVLSIAQTHPEQLTDPSFMTELMGQQTYTVRGSVTANPPSDALRYFYAVLAFACIMMVSIGLAAVETWKANTSPLGARRTVGGQSWARSLAPTLTAAWVLSFGCVLVGFLYIRFGFGVSFGGKEFACVAILAASTLVSTFLGALFGAITIPGLQFAVVPIVTTVLSLFAGLYGPATQELGDLVARDLPMLSALNPVRQVYEAFFSLYFYDTYDRYAQILLTLAAMALVFFVVCVLVMRRQRYKSL